MKDLCLLTLFCSFFSLQSIAQSQFYSIPIISIDQYLRDSAYVLGRLDFDFPVDGNVYIQFDGEGYASLNDRIFVAANDKHDWDTNDGNVSFMSGIPGEGVCFSHTRTFSVTAGQHTFYAVASNYVEEGGTGIATIYGTFSVEFIPLQSS